METVERAVVLGEGGGDCNTRGSWYGNYLFLSLCSHQTGWTALAVRCIDKIAERKSMKC